MSTTSGSHCAPRRPVSSVDDLLRRARLAVELARRHDLDGVGDRDDACAERDVGAGDAVRVAEAVPPLVVVTHDRPRRREQVERLEELVADLGMRLDDPPLLVVERRRLEQHPVRDADLADVVEDRSEADRLDLLLGKLEQLRDPDGERREPLAMTVQVGVACLDRVGERACERRREQPLAQLLPRARGAVERVRDCRLELRVGKRLGHEAGGAARQRLAQGVVRPGAGDEHDGKGGVPRAHRFEQLEAGEARHDHVADDEVELVALQQASACSALSAPVTS